MDAFDRINNMLVVQVYTSLSIVDFCIPDIPREMAMEIVDEYERGRKNDVHYGSLLHFHRRLVHLCYDTIVKMARDPASGLKLTDTKRVNCLACAQRKRKKNRQFLKDSGTN